MHAVQRNQPQARTRTEQGPARFVACAPTAAVVHHQFKPGHLPSLQTGGRSLRGGCAVRRQTRAQAGAVRAARFLAIRPARHPHFAGWGGSLNELATIRRLIASGLDARVAAHVAADQSLATGAVQSLTERDPVHQFIPFKKSVSNADQAMGKDFSSGTKPFVGAAKSYD